MSNSKLDFSKLSKEEMISIFKILTLEGFIIDRTESKIDDGIKTKNYMIEVDIDPSYNNEGHMYFYSIKTEEDIQNEKRNKILDEMRTKEEEITYIEKQIKGLKRLQDKKLNERKNIDIKFQNFNKESQSTT